MSAAQLSAQRFRKILDAMARPGKILSLEAQAPTGLSSAQAGVAMTLIDATQKVWVRPGTPTISKSLADWFGFHAGTRPIADISQTDFVFAAPSDIAALSACRVGNDEYPDQSATVILELDELHNHGATLTGPGIKTSTNLSIPDPAFFARNATLFPLGLDFIFTCGDKLACLPRTTKVQA